MQQLKEILSGYPIGPWGVLPFSQAKLPFQTRNRACLPENPRTVIVLSFPYLFDRRAGNLSKYARGEDYHRVAARIFSGILSALSCAYPAGQFAAFADNSPFDEVDLAVKAGLGVRGKNTLLISPEYGSYLFLGEIVTDLALCEQAAPQSPAVCIGCGRCAQHCPGGAIGPGGVDASRCLSAVTQKKGMLTREEEALLRKSGMAWGCDICQDVCPMNREAKKTALSAFREDTLYTLTEEIVSGNIKNRAFSWRGKGVLRRNLAVLSGSSLPGDGKNIPRQEEEAEEGRL